MSVGVLFDLDGTLVVNYKDQTLLPGRLKMLQRLQKCGALMAAVTNRSAYYEGSTPEDVQASNEEFIHNAKDIITRVYWMERPSELQKPSCFMLRVAMQAEGMDPANTIYVGNEPVDQQAAEAAGIPFVHADEFFGPLGNDAVTAWEEADLINKSAEERPFEVYLLAPVEGDRSNLAALDSGALPGGRLLPGQEVDVALVRMVNESGWMLPKGTDLTKAHEAQVKGRLVHWYRSALPVRKSGEAGKAVSRMQLAQSDPHLRFLAEHKMAEWTSEQNYQTHADKHGHEFGGPASYMSFEKALTSNPDALAGFQTANRRCDERGCTTGLWHPDRKIMYVKTDDGKTVTMFKRHKPPTGLHMGAMRIGQGPVEAQV